jgi:hypothetical protein
MPKRKKFAQSGHPGCNRKSLNQSQVSNSDSGFKDLLVALQQIANKIQLCNWSGLPDGIISNQNSQFG